MPSSAPCLPPAPRPSVPRSPTSSWTPPTAEEWSAILRSVTIGRDLLFWRKAEFSSERHCVGSGGGDALSDCFEAAVRELDAAADVVAEAQKRLLTVTVETTKPG